MKLAREGGKEKKKKKKENKKKKKMRALSRITFTVAAVLVCLSSAYANGPISKLQCSTINPNPIVTNCISYLPPIVDLYGNLPYDSIPAYQNCVKERCVCTGAAVNTDITTDGIYCNESGWMETGYTTCSRFNHCFLNFWRCINTAVMYRYDHNRKELTEGEMDMAADIVAHGRKPGEEFELTDTYRSCRLKMCAAADSRENCGLITCLPNYTQCNEYMLPPPLPYHHQLCTQGCRAVLLMMALTISIVSFSLCCVCCCPAQVIITEPVIKENSSKGKKGSDDDDDSKTGSQAATSGRNSPTHTNHNSHISSKNENKPASHGSNAAPKETSTPHTEAQQRGDGNQPF